MSRTIKTTLNANRYYVDVRACQAPQSGGGKYRRPVVIRVLDANHGTQRKAVMAGAVREWRNVDSRYDGPRSEHGQAIRAARELADRLNRDAVPEFVADGI